MMLRTIIGAALIALGTSCTQVKPTAVVYHAAILAVSQRSGKYYTIENGHGIEHQITVALEPGGERLILLIFDRYDPATFGDEQDKITFLFAGPLPRDGRLWVEQLKGYRVDRRVP